MRLAACVALLPCKDASNIPFVRSISSCSLLLFANSDQLRQTRRSSYDAIWLKHRAIVRFAASICTMPSHQRFHARVTSRSLIRWIDLRSTIPAMRCLLSSHLSSTSSTSSFAR
jgi:hypothetical protein